MDVPRSGDIVLSLAGRDAGRNFFVLAVEEGYALVADGKLRRVDSPKRKKLKHLQFVARPELRVCEKLRAGEPVRSSELRKGMSEFIGELD